VGKAKGRLKLQDGSTIAVIGAGPAGTFFSHFAQQYARESSRKIRIVIFDGKNFLSPGPVGCNLCAGVIAETLIDKMQASGIQIPSQRIQSWIEGYCLCTAEGMFHLKHPRGTASIATVYRGNGPRFSTSEEHISFDDFLLKRLESEEVEVIPLPVREVHLGQTSEERARIIYGDQKERRELEVDLIVGAFGLNTTLLGKMKGVIPGYSPPQTLLTALAEIELPPEEIGERFRGEIFILTLGKGRIRFAALVPKHNHVTLSLIPFRDIGKEDIHEFLNNPMVRQVFPPGWKPPERFCFCFSRISTTEAKNPFGDRIVLIGDASYSRYYKNGLESAFLTAQLAARTAFNHGISAAHFRRTYLRGARRLIANDNYYGKLTFAVYELTNRIGLLSKAQSDIQRNPDGGPETQLRFIFWNMFTGNIPYREIFYKFALSRLQLKYGVVALRLIFAKLVEKLRFR